jgi:hypothetical protein
VPPGGSPLGNRQRLAATIAPQVQVMIGDQDDGKSLLVAIKTGEPLQNRLRRPKLRGTKVHAARPLARDCHSASYTDEIYAPPGNRATSLRERTRTPKIGSDEPAARSFGAVTKSGWDTAGGGKLLPSSEQLLQLDFAIVLHSCEVNAHRHREIIEEIHHLTGNTVPLSVEVVAADAQINGFLHTRSIGSTTVSLKVIGIHEVLRLRAGG